jgi:PAS domain S-box-containing protein
VWKALRAGHRLVVSDVSSDATLSDEHRAVYEANALLAYVSVPLIKQGRHVATLSVHQTTPRAWTDEEIAMVEETAERSWAAVERARAENALRASEAKLEAQLADTKLLQQVSAEIVHDAEEHVVYRTIANAASVVMRSDFASIQMLDTERGTIGELHLLAHRGFSAQASLHWEWVRPESKTTCAAALRAGRRVVVPDIDEWNDVKGSDDLALFRGANIRAMQTTPLRTRAGKLVGMLSTHWKHVHNPSDADLQRLDILARQAADLIERKQSGERELRRSEERYRDLVEQTVDGIFVADRDGRYVDVNSAGCEMLGMTRGEVLSSSFTDVFMEEDHPRLETTLAILREGEIHRGEWRFRRKDGSVFFGELVGRQLPDGRVQGVVRDITDRKQAEEALKEADRRKDEFLATLAHELRNPLAPLRNGLQVMRLTRNDGKAVEQVRNMMERQLGHMVRLIDDLLDSSRISEGKIELRKERVQLGAVVQHALETSRPLIEQAGLSLAVSVPPEPIFVDADVTRLSQVFANLLNNAAKFTESGGHVSLSVQREGSSAVVSVHDTGVGIPPSMLPKVFEMFTQVDRSLERTHGGLGIGLTIVKRLVEMHGGTIEARSGGYGMGSEFVLRLPAVAAAVKPNAAENGDGVQNGARRRVLVVDDNVDAAESLSMMLEIMGNETRMAHDGLEALDAAAGFHPDVVLLDIGMPRLNGFDACRRMREQPWGDNLVIVALTGWGQNEDRQRSHEAGFDMHMVKPVDPVDLEKLLASLETPAH